MPDIAILSRRLSLAADHCTGELLGRSNRDPLIIDKELKKKQWYGDSLAVLFVQSTPGSVLKLEIEQVMKTSGMKV